MRSASATRIVIDRIVIEAAGFADGDAESFRESLQSELSRLLEAGAWPENIESRAKVDGGELHSPQGGASPRSVAERVVQSLGGKS